MIKKPYWVTAQIIFFFTSTLLLGEVFDFYNIIPFWDTILHIQSGALGVVLIHHALNKYFPHIEGVILLACAAALMTFIGQVWEVFEWAVDYFLGANMQKSGLHDTMWDLVCNSIGIFMSVFYITNEKRKSV